MEEEKYPGVVREVSHEEKALLDAALDRYKNDFNHAVNTYQIRASEFIERKLAKSEDEHEDEHEDENPALNPFNYAGTGSVHYDQESSSISAAYESAALTLLMAGQSKLDVAVTQKVKEAGLTYLPRVYQDFVVVSKYDPMQSQELVVPLCWTDFIADVEKQLDAVDENVRTARMIRFETALAQSSFSSKPSSVIYEALVSQKEAEIISGNFANVVCPTVYTQFLSAKMWNLCDSENKRKMLIRAAAMEQVELDLYQRSCRINIDLEVARMSACKQKNCFRCGIEIRPFIKLGHRKLQAASQEAYDQSYCEACFSVPSFLGQAKIEIDASLSQFALEQRQVAEKEFELEKRLETVAILSELPLRLKKMSADLVEKEISRLVDDFQRQIKEQRDQENQKARQKLEDERRLSTQKQLRDSQLLIVEACLRRMRKIDAFSPSETLDEHIGELGGLAKYLKQAQKVSPLHEVDLKRLEELDKLYSSQPCPPTYDSTVDSLSIYAKTVE